MEGLKLVPIGKNLDVITDYHANGSYENLKDHVTFLDEEDYAIAIRTLNFERNDFRDDLIYVDKAAYEYLSKSYVLPNDILMNKIANPGSVYLMPDMGRPVTCGMNLFLIRFKDNVNQKYMYYNMKNVEAYIKSFSHGTTTKTITKDDVRGINLYIHDPKEQDKIEYVLTSIDRKINNDRDIIYKLSNLLKFLYRRWFLEYNFPINGKLYRENKGKLVYNKLLQFDIPKDWRVVSLKKRFAFERGIEVGADNYQIVPTDNSVLFYRVSDLNSSSDIYVDKELIDGCCLEENDVCVSFDGTVGKVDFGINGAYSSGIRKVYDIEGILNNAFIYTFFISDYAQFTINKFATGSNILHSSESINNMYMAYDEAVYAEFVKIITPIFNRMQAAKSDMSKWIGIKKVLLPALMNNQAKYIK